MRLEKDELAAITSCFVANFKKGDQLWLFGSRVDDQQKGGDIDLYIETQIEDANLVVKQKLEFLAKLLDIIEEQKIDVVINRIAHSQPLAIYKEAKSKGVRLV